MSYQQGFKRVKFITYYSLLITYYLKNQRLIIVTINSIVTVNLAY